MEKSQSHMTERMLNLTLEIIYLMTGENYIAFKLSDGLAASNVMKTQSSFMESPCNSTKKNKKVQEVTSEIIELLMGEVPIRCQDATGYLSMDELKYLGGHKGVYNDVMMENQKKILTSSGVQTAWKKCTPRWEEHANLKQEVSTLGLRTSALQDGSSNRNPPTKSKRCPRPLDSQDSTQEHHKIPHHGQASVNAPQTDCRADARVGTEDLYMMGDGPCKEEDVPLEISPVPRETRTIPINVSADEEEADVICVKIEEAEVPLDISIDGRYSSYTPMKRHVTFPEGEKHDGHITGETLDKNSVTPNCHLVPFSADPLPHSSTHGGSLFNHSAAITHHTGQRRGAMFQCPICVKCFSWKASLVDHLRTHTGEKPYSCSECGKKFSKKNKLTLHTRTHTGERPYSCTECGKCFTRRDHLIIHQRTHTGVKPYSCSDCGKSFSQKAFLIVHQRAHTGIKPYSCSECGKCFTGKAHLMVHQRTHTGLKPHSCSECGKCFTERSQLLRHEASHSGVRPHTCLMCGRSFSSRSSLVRHQHVHTNGNPQLNPELGP